jgi:excisionase family DNA binding protein
MSHDSAEPCHSPRHVCELLGISLPTLYRIVARGEMEAFKIGRATRIRQSEIDRYVSSRTILVARTGLNVRT